MRFPLFMIPNLPLFSFHLPSCFSLPAFPALQGAYSFSFPLSAFHFWVLLSSFLHLHTIFRPLGSFHHYSARVFHKLSSSLESPPYFPARPIGFHDRFWFVVQLSQSFTAEKPSVPPQLNICVKWLIIRDVYHASCLSVPKKRRTVLSLKMSEGDYKLDCVSLITLSLGDLFTK